MIIRKKYQIFNTYWEQKLILIYFLMEIPNWKAIRNFNSLNNKKMQLLCWKMCKNKIKNLKEKLIKCISIFNKLNRKKLRNRKFNCLPLIN